MQGAVLVKDTLYDWLVHFYVHLVARTTYEIQGIIPLQHEDGPGLALAHPVTGGKDRIHIGLGNNSFLP